MLRIRKFIQAGLASLRSARWQGDVQYDEARHSYHNSVVFRGFPIGSIGSGGFGVGTSGGFQDLRINNNWMRPLRHAKGAFWAASYAPLEAAQEGPQDRERHSRILRRVYSGGAEYPNIAPIQDVDFTGRIPTFTQQFRDHWPLQVDVTGFSPLTPNNTKDASLPAAHFTVTLRNTSDAPIDASFLFSWDNLLGCGGTGQTGVKLWHGLITRLKGWLEYDDTDGNYQLAYATKEHEGIHFATTQSWPDKSHRQSVLGRYLLLGEKAAQIEWSRSLAWDSQAASPAILTQFATTGQLNPLDDTSTWTTEKAQSHCDPMGQPAAALCARTTLAPQSTRELRFVLAWWTPAHTPEKEAPQRAKTGQHQGVRAGHFYENYFSSAGEVATYLSTEKPRLWAESTALHELLDASDLPAWLKHALPNAADSVICNTILPKDGTLHTLEGMDWPWYFGGLCGTNDQRLSSQPFTSLFFNDLDKSEVEAFRLLMKDGAIPHGIGNCDLALSDADVPYGWPIRILGALAEDDWPDLTLSAILQITRLYKITGDQAWLDRAWPDLWKMLDALKKTCRHGIPEGGSTYDTYKFPGTFLYTGTLMLAALDAMIELSTSRMPTHVQGLQAWRDTAAARIQEALWKQAGGHYRAAEDKDTLFLGGLAGDWFARYMGLPPVLPPEQVHTHLLQQHRALIEPHPGRHAPAAYPDLEATFDGRPIPTKALGIFPIHGYAWQVISYHGCEAIYAGLVEEGLHAIHLLYDRMWHGGWPWSADLFGNPGAVYMTHPVLWALPQALTGAALDVPQRTLQLSPANLGGRKKQAIPFFFPGFWAMLHTTQETDGQQLTVEVHKHFGNPILLETIIVTDHNDLPQRHTPTTPWLMEKGKRYQLTVPRSHMPQVPPPRENSRKQNP